MRRDDLEQIILLSIGSITAPYDHCRLCGGKAAQETYLKRQGFDSTGMVSASPILMMP
jgi:hypothetical protein